MLIGKCGDEFDRMSIFFQRLRQTHETFDLSTQRARMDGRQRDPHYGSGVAVSFSLARGKRNRNAKPNPMTTQSHKTERRVNNVIASAFGSVTPIKSKRPVIVVSTTPMPAGRKEAPPANPPTAKTKTAAGKTSFAPSICAIKNTTSPSAKRAS